MLKEYPTGSVFELRTKKETANIANFKEPLNAILLFKYN